MMPSSIAPIELTRSYAVRPAQGLRFGNFEGVVHLPPVKQPSVLGLHSYSTLNNQQIYRTVGEWVQSWQPWQQKLLLYSIVNRCSLPQLEILATTLEPLRHRDPLNASRRKAQLSLMTPSMKRSPSLVSSSNKLLQTKTPQNSPVKSSQLSKKAKPQAPTGDKQVHTEKGPVSQNLDQYATIVSSAVVAAALGEFSMGEKLGQIMKSELKSIIAADKREVSSAENGSVKKAVITTEGNSPRPEVDKLSSAMEREGDASTQICPRPPLSANIRPGILRSANGKKADRSRNTSAQFLGGRISFTPQSRQSRRPSGSSRYRYSAFASSTASTPDFFSKKNLNILGPMQRSIRTGQVQKPTGLGSIPVSLQRFYKNRSFWSSDLPESMQLEAAHKRDLTGNFREQLSSINGWLDQWEHHERLSLLKDVVKLCNGDVLEALVIYIHQKLRDACDINRLQDKLLLYILSFLSPNDILNSAQVCRRWRYVCAMDDLWIVKCLELGETEGIDNIPQLIESANTYKMGVDWMLAFMELRSLVSSMKAAEARILSANSEQKSRSQAAEDGIGLGDSKRFRIRRRKNGDGEDSQTATTEKASRGRHIRLSDDQDSTVDNGMSEEDLLALMDDDGSDLLMPEFSSKRPGWSKGHRQSLRSTIEHRIGETLSEKSSLDNKPGRSSKASGERRSGVKEEEDDAVLDIHTDLSQSKDLLGKVVPAMSLEWQTPDHEDDFIRYPVYIGKVVTVQKVRKIQGHLGGIQCLQFDRRRLITGGVDRSVRLWDVRSGRSVHKFYGHKGGVRCVKFDDEILVTGSWDSVILVWNIRKFTRSALLHGHENSVSCLQIVKHYVISGSHDHTVRVWSRPTFMCTLVLRGHSGPVLSLEADDEYVYSTASDLTIRMTDLLTGMCERVFERSNSSPLNCLSMHGALLLAGDTEGRVYFWNTETGEAEAAVKVHDAPVNTIQYHNGRFYTGSSDCTMTEYDLMTMTRLRVLRGHKGPVRALQVSDRRFVSCSDDGTVRIWDLYTDKTTSLSSVF